MKKNWVVPILLIGIILVTIFCAGCTVINEDPVVYSEENPGGTSESISVSGESASFSTKNGDHISFESTKINDLTTVTIKVNTTEYTLTISDKDNETLCGEWKNSDGTSIIFTENGKGKICDAENKVNIYWGINIDGYIQVIQWNGTGMKYTVSGDVLRDTNGRVFQKL